MESRVDCGRRGKHRGKVRTLTLYVGHCPEREGRKEGP